MLHSPLEAVLLQNEVWKLEYLALRSAERGQLGCHSGAASCMALSCTVDRAREAALWDSEDRANPHYTGRVAASRYWQRLTCAWVET